MSKIILVTGANRGLGFEIASQLSRIRHQVIFTCRDEKKGMEAFSRLKGNVVFHTLDVTNQSSITDLFQFVSTEFHKLDVLINNAGVSGKTQDLKNVTVEEVKRIMETNFYGPMRMNKTFLPLLQKSDDARIINMSSGMGALGSLTGGYAGYRLSKAGLNAQTILLSHELRQTRIRVFSMCPGWVRTDMGGESAPRSVEKGAETAVWLATENNLTTGKFYRDKKIISW